MQINYFLHVELHHSHDELVSCAGEISEYFMDHGNWRRPILPEDGSCVEMEFDPERFDPQGNRWMCDVLKEGGR